MQFDLFDSGSNTILGAPTYQEFKDQLIASNCTKCGLHAGRTQIVVDRGNPAAPLPHDVQGPWVAARDRATASVLPRLSGRSGARS